LGQKLDEKVIWGEIGSGAGFLVRGGGGRKAKVVLCAGTAKHTIHPELVLCVPGARFRTPKFMFVASVPDNWFLVCAFSNDVLLMSC
jgi:hypothetical protein